MSDKLIGLPVETELGQRLGAVRGFEVDVDSQAIVRYNVKPSGIASIIGRRDLVINSGQVVAITAEKMTVKDNVVLAEEANDQRAISLGKGAVPIMPRELQ